MAPSGVDFQKRNEPKTTIKKFSDKEESNRTLKRGDFWPNFKWKPKPKVFLSLTSRQAIAEFITFNYLPMRPESTVSAMSCISTPICIQLATRLSPTVPFRSMFTIVCECT